MKDLTISQVAKDLGLTRQAVHKYCKQGFLPYRLEYEGNLTKCLINSDDYYIWKRKHFSGVAKGKISKNYSKSKELTKLEIKSNWLPEWSEWLRSGKLGGKPISPRTIEIYIYYIGYFLELLPKRPSPPIISVHNYRHVLTEIPVESFATRRHVYDALMSLTKYLIEIKQFSIADREKLKALRPKRYLPPKRHCISEIQYKQLSEYAFKTAGNDSYDRLINYTLVAFIANTGLRASEVANLILDDIDLNAGIVHVWLGKGNKNRKVGITKECQEALTQYLTERLKTNDSNRFFLNAERTPFNRKTISQKLKRLSKPLGFKVSAHQLRRYFVTSSVSKGKPLNHLRIACGHSDISTTQSYCMTSVDEVVEAMKGW